MRILMVTSEFPPNCGGIGWYVYYLCSEMISQGHKITILQRASNLLEAFDSYHRVPIPAGNIPMLNAFRMVRNVRSYLKNDPHDIAIVHATPLGAWISDIPTLLVVHCCLAECDKRIYRGAYDSKSILHRVCGFVYREVERRSIHGADKVCVVSQAMKMEIAAHYSVDAHYVGNGVDNHVFRPSSDNGKRAVLLPSMLRSGKGVREAVRTIQTLREKGCDIPFRFIENGPMKPWLVKQINKLGISGVELLPPVEHKRLKVLYQESSIVFLPSYYEGLPTIALEAMASGLPVVASNAGGTAEVVREGKTGFIRRLNDIDGMAESILRLDKEAALREEMGNNGQKLILEHYTWGAVCDRLEAIMTALV